MIKVKNKSLLIIGVIVAAIVAVLSTVFGLMFAVFEIKADQTYVIFGYEALLNIHDPVYGVRFDNIVGFNGKYPCYHLVTNIILVCSAIAFSIYYIVMIAKNFKANGIGGVKGLKSFSIISCLIVGLCAVLNAILMLTCVIDGTYWRTGVSLGSYLCAGLYLLFAIIFIVMNVIVFSSYKKAIIYAYSNEVESNPSVSQSNDDPLADILGLDSILGNSTPASTQPVQVESESAPKVESKPAPKVVSKSTNKKEAAKVNKVATKPASKKEPVKPAPKKPVPVKKDTKKKSK